MPRKPYSKMGDFEKITHILRPSSQAKHYAKGWLSAFLDDNPKASKKEKLEVWREGFFKDLWRRK